MMASGYQRKGPPIIGRRTGVDVKAGKTIRILPGGFENFDDYWTEEETEESFHVSQLDEKSSTKVSRSPLDKKRSTKVSRKPVKSMSPFTSVEVTPPIFVERCADDNDKDASDPGDMPAAVEGSKDSPTAADDCQQGRGDEKENSKVTLVSQPVAVSVDMPVNSVEKCATHLCHLGNVIGSISRVQLEPQSAQPKVKTRKRLTYSASSNNASVLEEMKRATPQTKGKTTFKVPNPPEDAPTEMSIAHTKSQGTSRESSSLTSKEMDSKTGLKATKSTEEDDAEICTEHELKPKKSKGNKSRKSNKVSMSTKDKLKDNTLSAGASYAETDQVEETEHKQRKSKRNLGTKCDGATGSPARGGHKTTSVQQRVDTEAQESPVKSSPLKPRNSKAQSKDTAKSSVKSTVTRHKLANRIGAFAETPEDGSESEPESETEPLFKSAKDNVNSDKVTSVDTAPFSGLAKSSQGRSRSSKVEKTAAGSQEDEMSDMDPEEAKQDTSVDENSGLDDSSVNMLTLKSKLSKNSSPASKPAHATQRQTEKSKLRKNTTLKSSKRNTKGQTGEDPDQLEEIVRSDENEGRPESSSEAEVPELVPVRTGGRRAKATAPKSPKENGQEATEYTGPLASRRTRGKQPMVSKETVILEQKQTRGTRNKRPITGPQDAESPAALDSHGKRSKKHDLTPKRTKGKKETEEALEPKPARKIPKSGSKKFKELSENVEMEENHTEDATVELARKATAGGSVHGSMMSAGKIGVSSPAKSAQIPQHELSPFASKSKGSEIAMEEAADTDVDDMEPLVMDASDSESETQHGEGKLEERALPLDVESEVPQDVVRTDNIKGVKCHTPLISAPVSDSDDDYEVVPGNEFVFMKNKLPDTELSRRLSETKTAEKSKIKSKRKGTNGTSPISKLSHANKIQKARNKSVSVSGVDAACLPASMNFNFEDSALDGDDDEAVESPQSKGKALKNKGNTKKNRKAFSRKDKKQKTGATKSKSSEDIDTDACAESANVDAEPRKVGTKGNKPKTKGRKSKASSEEMHNETPRVVLTSTKKSSSSEGNSKPAESKKKTKGSSSEGDHRQVQASEKARKRKGIVSEDNDVEAQVLGKSPRKAIEHNPRSPQLTMSPEYDPIATFVAAVDKDTSNAASDSHPQNTSIKGTKRQQAERALLGGSSKKSPANTGRKASYRVSPLLAAEPMSSSDSDESCDDHDDVPGPALPTQFQGDDEMMDSLGTPDVSAIEPPGHKSSRWRQIISPEPMEFDSPLPPKRTKKGTPTSKSSTQGRASRRQVTPCDRKRTVAIQSPPTDSRRKVPRSILKRPSVGCVSTLQASGLPVHFHEVTESATPDVNRPAAKQVKIIAPEPPPAEGIRRSQRTRVPPLDWFRGERIKYDRRRSGLVVAGILHEGQDELELAAQNRRKKKVKNLAARKQARRRKAIPQTPRNLSVHQDLPREMREFTSSEIPVINPVTQEEVLVDCLVTKEQCQFFNAAGEPARPDDPLILCKGIKQRAFSLGQLILRPGEEKGTQLVRTDSMIFIIKKGKMAVTIHRTTSVLETDDTFFVPQGNTYNIRNLRNDEGKLWFIQHKG